MNLGRLQGGHVIALGAALAAPLALFVSKAMAPLFLATAILALGIELMRRSGWPRPPLLPTVILALAAAAGFASAGWSMTPEASSSQSFSLVVIFSLGLALVSLAHRLGERTRHIVGTALIGGVCLGYVLLAIEATTPLAITFLLRKLVFGYEIGIDYTYANYYKTGATVTALLTWPAAIVLLRRGAARSAATLGIMATFVVFISGSVSSMFSLVAGLTAFALALALRAQAGRILQVLVILGVALAPLVHHVVPEVNQVARMAPGLPDSVYPRIVIWRSAAGLIAENPFLGKGLDTARAISQSDDSIRFLARNLVPMQVEPIPLHPHNAVLQIWLELGSVGAILLLMLLLALIRGIERSAADGVVRAASLGGFVATLAVASVSYGIWHTWWQGTLWLTAALTVAALAGATEAKDESDGGAEGGALVPGDSGGGEL